MSPDSGAFFYFLIENKKLYFYFTFLYFKKQAFSYACFLIFSSLTHEPAPEKGETKGDYATDNKEGF